MSCKVVTTPSPGLKIAARFIRARLASLGIEPGAKEGYLYEYPLDFARLDGEKTFAKLGEQELVEGDDYYTRFITTEHLDIVGKMVWLGEESKEAWAAPGIKGNWVVTRAETIRGYHSARKAAEAAGALGVVRLLPTNEKVDESLGSYAEWDQDPMQRECQFPEKQSRCEFKETARRQLSILVHARSSLRRVDGSRSRNA